MHPDKRRAGRRIRKSRRQLRELNQAFTRFGQVAGVAADNLSRMFAIFVEASARLEVQAEEARDG